MTCKLCAQVVNEMIRGATPRKPTLHQRHCHHERRLVVHSDELAEARADVQDVQERVIVTEHVWHKLQIHCDDNVEGREACSNAADAREGRGRCPSHANGTPEPLGVEDVVLGLASGAAQPNESVASTMS